MKFGDYLRQKREESGWTQPEAAARAGIEQSYISKLETGKSYPSGEIFEKLVKLYGIDVKDMGAQVTSSELEKLKEIAEVRTYILGHQKAKTTVVRTWLLAALVFMMVGGGMTVFQAAKPERIIREYVYQSDGLLLPDDGPMFFKTLELPSFPKATPEVVARMIVKTKTLPESAGAQFFETEGNYVRAYQIIDERTKQVNDMDRLMLAIGVAFLFGSFGCFVISHRWR